MKNFMQIFRVFQITKKNKKVENFIDLLRISKNVCHIRTEIEK